MNRSVQRVVAGCVAFVHLAVYGISLPVYAQDVVSQEISLDKDVAVNQEHTASDQLPLAEHDTAVVAQQADGGADSLLSKQHGVPAADSSEAGATESDYYQGNTPTYQGVRRGMAVSGTSAPTSRKMTIDTSSAASAVTPDTAVLESSPADDSLMAESSAPALQLGKRGKIIAGVVSAVVLCGAGVLIYLKYTGTTESEETGGIPDPPSPPGM